MKRVVGYVRCSTEEQASSDFNTLEHQKQVILEYVERRKNENWTLLRFYDDTLSGKNMNRPGLQAMISDCESGLVDVIVFYKFDRVSRSLRDFVLMDHQWTQSGVDSVSVMENWDTSTPAGRAMRNIALTFAEFEREQTAERTKNKMYAQAKKGLFCGGQIPFGYVNSDKKLIVVPEEAVHVRKAFDLYAKTSSLAEVRDYLNAHGVVPRQGGPRTGRLQPQVWTNQRVDRMLRNPIYKGTLKYSDLEVHNAHEPVVTEELFKECAGIPRQHNREMVADYPFDFLLSGKVLCGHCGCRMSPKPVRHANRPKSQTPYYECAKVIKFRDKDCTVKRINGELLQEALFHELNRLADMPEVLESVVAKAVMSGTGSVADTLDSLRTTEEALGLLNTKASRLITALESADANANTAMIVERLSTLESQKKALERELLELRSKMASLDGRKLTVEDAQQMLRNFSDLIAAEPDAEIRRRLVALLVKEVKVEEGGKITATLYCPQGVPNYNASGSP